MSALPAAERFAACCWSSRSILRRFLPSAFVDDRVMRSMSSASEWRDHLRYERALLTEIAASGDPASVVYASSDELHRVTPLISNLVIKREAKYGSVQGLFSDPERRHLAELSVCARRLSYILERSGCNEYQQRLACIAQARSQEEEAIESRWLSSCESDVSKIPTSASKESSCVDISLRNPAFGEVFISMTVDPNEGGANIAVLVGIGKSGRKFGLHRMLPGGFQSYMRPSNRSRLNFSLSAWRLAIAQVACKWGAA